MGKKREGSRTNGTSPPQRVFLKKKKKKITVMQRKALEAWLPKEKWGPINKMVRCFPSAERLI
jgi:hypothetical protein